jgi:cytochrome b6-f complex iron-sulfur subunit
MDERQQTRRQFCARSCTAASVAAIGGVVAGLAQGCGGGGSPTSPGANASALPIVNGTLNGSTITVTVTGTALATPGTLALVRTSGGDVLVARTSATSFVSLSAACTHANCEITGSAGQSFYCPCHGSQFDTSGNVVAGPALSPLRKFAVQFAADVLTITA